MYTIVVSEGHEAHPKKFGSEPMQRVKRRNQHRVEKHKNVFSKKGTGETVCVTSRPVSNYSILRKDMMPPVAL